MYPDTPSRVGEDKIQILNSICDNLDTFLLINYLRESIQCKIQTPKIAEFFVVSAILIVARAQKMIQAKVQIL